MRLSSHIASATSASSEVPKSFRGYQIQDFLPGVGHTVRAKRKDKLFYIEKPVDVLYHLIYFPQLPVACYFLAASLSNLFH